MASFMSSITLLGVPAEFYSHGTQFVLIDLGYALLAPVAAYFFLPVYFKLQATSAYEYLARRFGPTARSATSLVYSIQMVLYMGIVLYAPGIALQALTELSQEWCIFAVGIVCTFYSTLGGMKAVITTDVFQAILMYAAVFLVVISAAIELGGFSQIWKIANEHGRIEFFNFSFDPTVRHTFWSLIVGGGFQFLSLYAVNQTQVQRYLSMKDLKTAVKALYISIPILCLLSFTTAFSGLALFSKYADCDPVASGRIPSSDQLLPLYIIETVGDIPGVTGIFIAGVFSAALSTVSALLNALAAVTLEDYVKPAYLCITKQSLDGNKNVVYITKCLALIYGLICLGVAYSAKYLGSVLQASLTIFGAVGGPLLGIFSLGMFVPLANEPGALVGMITGLFVTLCLGFGGPKPPIKKLPVSTEGCPTNTTSMMFNSINKTSILLTSTSSVPVGGHYNDEHYFYLYRISYLWYISIGFLITMFIGTLVSTAFIFTGNKVPDSKMDPDLFSPPVAAYLKRKRLEQNMETEISDVYSSGRSGSLKSNGDNTAYNGH
ncbi:putative sodium-dependent multivitamin transporter isoform X2 [Lycorma delicatula]